MSSINSGPGFKAAFGAFSEATYQLIRAIGKAPFSGGWKKLIVVGPPVLLIASGTGALIFTIMTRCLRYVAGTVYDNTTKIYKHFYKNRSITPVLPTATQQTDYASILNGILPRPAPAPSIPPNPAPEVDRPLPPPPIDAAKERNEFLLKILGLIEKPVIDSLVERKDLYFGEKYSKEELKRWLKCMTLWRLGILWDQSENLFVQMKTPLPPTAESIINLAKQINPQIGEAFQHSLPSNNDLTQSVVDKRSTAIWEAIQNSALTNSEKAKLALLSFELNEILTKKPVNPGVKANEEQEIRKQFAQIMNRGIATTTIHMISIIKGLVSVVYKPSLAAVPKLVINIPSNDGNHSNPFSKMVKATTSQVQKELTTKYLTPLWDKKYREWDAAVKEDLKKQISDKSISLFERFMSDKIDEKAFLEDPDSHKLSTALTSRICFIKAVRCMRNDQKMLEGSTQYILDSLFAQLHPTLTDTLTKSADMLAQISFERTVPRVVDYSIELLECCTAMQAVREDKLSKLEGSFFIINNKKGGDPLIEALKNAGLNQENSSSINQLYMETSTQISGKDIIAGLPKVHETVRLSLEDPEYELTWIRKKKEDLRTLLRVRAGKYAKQKGTWLSSLFETNLTGQPTNIVNSLLTLSNKLRGIPGFEGVMTFLFSGVESVLEDKVSAATQVFLNEFTSTGYLSTNIATSLVKGLLSKDDTTWKKNLPVLQEAYQFLQPEEQEQVLKHLNVQFEGDTFLQRRKELVSVSNYTAVTTARMREITNMKKREDGYKAAENQLASALQKAIGAKQDTQVNLLAEAYRKIKREKELQHFYRVRTLVTYVAGEFLKEVFTFKGGEALKNICIKVLHEALTLLTCQEIIKHWIFTIVDLIIDELKESGNSNPNTPKLEPTHPKSLLDLIKADQQSKLLASLAAFMNAAEKDKAWLSLTAWWTWGTTQVTTWLPGKILEYIEPLKPKLVLTPEKLKDKVVEWVADFGTNPLGLSDLIIQALTEHVADPRVSNPKSEQ